MTEGASTAISGREISDLCMRLGGMLNLDIYDTEKNAVAPELQQAWQFNKNYWRKLWEIANRDGFRCAFYAPRTGPSSNRAELCPPVLVFRGSDSEPEDFAELAFAMRVAVNYNIDMPWPADDVIGRTNLDSSFSAAPDHNGKTLAGMRSSGLMEQAMFAGVSGTTTVNIDGPARFNVDAVINWTVDSSLFYGTNGDWAVNFAQGLGRLPGQYQAAIDAGKRAAAEAMADWNRRIIITGHSLGGGLASAAAVAARIAQPTLRIRSTTYNAAGLHANTARQAGGTLATPAAVPIRAVHVKDEILNSMQARSRMVPFLSDLLAWSGQSMPPAVANPSPSPGVSPGLMPIMGKTYADKFATLPVLFTIDRQQLGPRLTELAAIIAIANSARDLPTFVNELVRHLLDRLLEGGNISIRQAIDLFRGWQNIQLPANLGAGIVAAIKDDLPPPRLPAQGQGIVATRLVPFVNALIQDVVTLGRVMLASGNYHTMPPVAFTFLLDRRS